MFRFLVPLLWLGFGCGLSLPLAAATNANLSSLEFWVGPLTPAFSPAQTNYSITVSNDMIGTFVTHRTEDEAATVRVSFNGAPFIPPYGGPYSLVDDFLVGTNVLRVRVTASDTVTQREYRANIIRVPATPTVSTLAPVMTATNCARLRAVVNPNGQAATAWFEWGISTNLGQASSPFALPSGSDPTELSFEVCGLVPSVTNFFRLMATNSTGASASDVHEWVSGFVPLASPLPGVFSGASAWGDFDNDGRLDLLLTGLSSNGPITQLWRNTSTGLVMEPTSFPGVYDGAVAWADFDNDGRLDVLLTGFGGFSSNYQPLLVAGIWRNTGAGFTLLTNSFPGVRDSAVACPDLDGDGRSDVLIAGETLDPQQGWIPICRWWRNTSSGFVATASSWPGFSRGVVVCRDFDGDRRVDVLLSGATMGDPVTELWRNVGGGVFSKEPLALTGLFRSRAAWTDFNLDGRADFWLTGVDTNLNRVTELWQNTVTGFVRMTNGLPASAGLGRLASADADNDGRPDLLSAGDVDLALPEFLTASLVRGTSTGGQPVSVGLPVSAPGIGDWVDFDRDGRNDAFLQPDDPWPPRPRNTNRVFVAYRTDGIDGTGTADNPRDGSRPEVVYALLNNMNNRYLMFGPGRYVLTNSVFFEDNNTVIGAGWGVTVFAVNTNVTAPAEFVAFYPATDHSTNNLFRGFTLDLQGHLNTAQTGPMCGLFSLGSGNLYELEVMNPRGNWVTSQESFALLVGSTHASNPTIYRRGNVVRCRVIATNAVYPYDYITAIGLGGVAHAGDYNGLDIAEDCMVIGGAATNVHCAYAMLGKGMLRHSRAINVSKGLYGETQSVGATNGDNGRSIIYGNHFTNVAYGVFLRGLTTNTDIQIFGNRLDVTHNGMTALYDDGGALSNFVFVGNSIAAVGGGSLSDGGMRIAKLQHGLVAHNLLGAGIASPAPILCQQLSLINNRFTDGTPVFPSLPPGASNTASGYIIREWDAARSLRSNLPPAKLWRNLTSQTNTAPSAPAGLLSSIAGGVLTLSWQPGVDNETTNSGVLSYNLRVGSTPGGGQFFSAPALAGGSLTLPEIGRAGTNRSWSFIAPTNQPLYWSVQCVDHAMTGSAFSPEQGITFALVNTNSVAGDLDGDGWVDLAEAGQVYSNYWRAFPPTVMAFSTVAGELLQLDISGMSGLRLEVEASSDLTNWHSLGITAPLLEVMDPEATNFNQRFYRLRLPQ